MKKEARKRSSKPVISRDAEKLNSILVENFVNLQRALTNLTVKFDSLADNISKLLQLFEISARSFAEKLATSMPDIEKDREFLDKLNRLLEQNKVIAKGLTLMEERIRERIYGHSTPQPTPSQIPITRQRLGFMPATQSFQPSFQPALAEEGYLPSSLEGKKTKPLEEQ